MNAFFLISLSVFAEHLDPVNVKIAELREALESVTLEQRYLKARDVRHRHSKTPLVSRMNSLLLYYKVH